MTVATAAGQEVTLSSQVVEAVLPNGLKVLMVKRAEAPLIRCILAYRVGSVNERPGITGISHFHGSSSLSCNDEPPATSDCRSR